MFFWLQKEASGRWIVAFEIYCSFLFGLNWNFSDFEILIMEIWDFLKAHGAV